ncbi:MAG: acetate uptake transporter family protein [Syntrophomonadaceae bacterium]|jgi:succinate-acetate transporter protein
MSQQGQGWANPAPAGLTALAIACFTFYALLTGKVDHTALPLLGAWLIGGFLVQVIVGVIELKEGSLIGGNVFTVFAAFFMLTGGIEMFVKFIYATNNLALDARMDGWAWLVLSITLLVWCFGYFKTAPLSLNLAVIGLVFACPLIAFKDLGLLGASAGIAAGNLLLFTGIMGLYTAAGIILNTTYGKTILPMGGPFIK